LENDRSGLCHQAALFVSASTLANDMDLPRREPGRKLKRAPRSPLPNDFPRFVNSGESFTSP